MIYGSRLTRVALGLPRQQKRFARAVTAPSHGSGWTVRILSRSRVQHRHFSSFPSLDRQAADKESDDSQSKLFYSPAQKRVMSKCRELHASIMPINERVSTRYGYRDSDRVERFRTIPMKQGRLEITDRCDKILLECGESTLTRPSLLDSQLRGPLSPQSDRGTALPFVFLVGNHSSGKSSFINYVLGRKIQTSGVAPTDDCA